VTRLFVYGTLAPGGEAWPRLERWSAGEPQTDAVPGRLYDTGRGYPAATFSADASGLVHGVVVDIDPMRACEAIARLDRYEGPEYERIEVRTAAGADVFTYAWIAPLEGCDPVPDGRWRG
jgi:gamma-glutamylcyclotransferase (GGCT)/AIG2-like uncharacterized protein YtfP